MKKPPGNFLKEWASLALPETVFIESLGNRVGGIARPEGYPAVFVRGALPGEEVAVRVTTRKKSVLEAEMLSVKEPSPHRIDPICAYYGVCGGCSLQHVSYEHELFWKREWVKKALRNLEKPAVQPVIPSPAETGYRNRVTFDAVNGKLTLHAFRGDPIPVDFCPLMNRNAEKAFRELVETDYSDGIERVSVRGSVNTADRGVEFFSKGKWIREHRITEKLNGLLFPVPSGGFFQVNTSSAEILVKTVTALVPGENGRVLDLYGGVGTFGIPLASRGMTVDSVEMNRAASEGCAEAAELNHIPPGRLFRFNQRDRNFLSKALENGKKFSAVITDPPRAGMGIRTARQIRRLAPDRIIYVSCNPFSAARDIAVLAEDGYTITEVIPIDMFPRTDHVETVFLLEGKGR